MPCAVCNRPTMNGARGWGRSTNTGRAGARTCRAGFRSIVRSPSSTSATSNSGSGLPPADDADTVNRLLGDAAQGEAEDFGLAPGSRSLPSKVVWSMHGDRNRPSRFRACNRPREDVRLGNADLAGKERFAKQNGHLTISQVLSRIRAMKRKQPLISEQLRRGRGSGGRAAGRTRSRSRDRGAGGQSG